MVGSGELLFVIICIPNPSNLCSDTINSIGPARPATLSSTSRPQAPVRVGVPSSINEILHRWFQARTRADPEGTLTLVLRLHWVC
jgi:hypothetical protein